MSIAIIEKKKKKQINNTHPLSPNMMTFNKTFFLDAIA